jgi:hypothetical protein
MKDIEKFLKAAGEGIVTVVFEKINNGGTRIMECTLKPEIMPLSKAYGKEEMHQIKQRAESDHLVVWALDRDSWRSFRVSTVTDWYEGKPKDAK